MVPMFRYHPPLYREVMSAQLMANMLMVLLQILTTVRPLFILQTIILVQAHLTVPILAQLMHMLLPLVIFIKIASPIMREGILVMTEPLLALIRAMSLLVITTITNQTLITL
jgi:hypothetical protein